MKINNWVLKAGVPSDCFHLHKRFITADTEVKLGRGGGNKCEISIYRSFIRFAFCHSLKPLSHSTICHTMPCHATPLHTMPWYVSFARRKYFFISHLALRFTSLSAFNWKLSTLREKKNWVFYTLEYKFHFFPFSFLFSLVFFFLFSHFCFHFFSLFPHSDYYSVSAPSRVYEFFP